MLWYLHLCSSHGVVVVNYRDSACGLMNERPDGSGEFVRVTLRPVVTVLPGADREKALALHDQAHHMCFIARSVNFPVETEAELVEAAG
jgi:organic hydroperoxide reductase OsmC/OhrA